MIEHRVLLGVRAAYGSLLLVRPSFVCTVLAGRPPDTVTCATAGALGVRHLAQAALTARLGPRAAPAGVATDLAHALSVPCSPPSSPTGAGSASPTQPLPPLSASPTPNGSDERPHGARPVT
ncbi:hypothetical protein AB0A71_20355 [Kitasatospora aureofaciens]|uniref:hypothetical protein n=1 Tax=Kitasatospora aureofaciens TaxID=1894 RepID=UPI0033F4CA93